MLRTAFFYKALLIGRLNQKLLYTLESTSDTNITKRGVYKHGRFGIG